MSVSVIFSDVELLLTQALRNDAAAGQIGNTFPTSPTASTIVRIIREGGRRKNQLVETARVGVSVFAKTDKEATDLALKVRALIESYGDVRPFGRVTGQGISTIPNNTGYKQRYFVIDVDLVGQHFKEDSNAN